MTVEEAFSRAASFLSKSNIGESSLEAEVLLRHAMGIDRVQLYLEPKRILNPAQEAVFWRFIKRRRGLEPIAYIINRREFYGLEFYVDKRVLIPRPETELLVEEAIGICAEQKISVIADVGTGSGAVAICLAKNLPRARIYATDISADALEVALENCRRHGAEDKIHLLCGDMLEVVPEAVDVLVANLPYVEVEELQSAEELKFEPKIALCGGENGLDKIQRLSDSLKGKVKPGGSVLVEIGQGQGDTVTAILRERFPGVSARLVPDLAGIDRVVRLSLPAS